MQGYVLQYDLLNRVFTVVHHSKASQPLRGDGRSAPVMGRATFDEKDLPPIVKRTPLERVDSLMLKWIADCKKAGTIPGLDDEKISEIVGEAWKSGRTEITADVVRQVAAHFLTDAEAKQTG